MQKSCASTAQHRLSHNQYRWNFGPGQPFLAYSTPQLRSCKIVPDFFVLPVRGGWVTIKQPKS